MQTVRLPEITAKRGLACLAALGMGVIASLVAGWGWDANSAQTPGPAPADTFAERFPAGWMEPAAPSWPSGVVVAHGGEETWLALLSPQPTYRTAALRPAPAAQAATSQPALAVPRPNPNRPRTMFNDAQIASIKERLNLTARQAQHWPPVEAALRAIVWPRTRKGERPAIDPNGADVQRLKSAAIPLMMTLSDEQRNEVRRLAHVMGLERVAAQF